MTDFTKLTEVLVDLASVQSDDSDNRDQARESHLFIDKPDGQWEPYYWAESDGKPRYTFDKVGPIVDQVSGEMEQADFSVTIKPAGGDATKDDAKLLDGMVRNIENISNAQGIYNMAGRSMVTAGLDGWQIKQKYIDDDSFDQDLVVERIANFVDSVWFWPFKEPDASDSPACVVLEAIPRKEYEDRWPKGGGQSVSDNRTGEAYHYKPDVVVVGQLYYIVEKPRDLLLMSNGQVLEDNDENRAILDELEALGIAVQQRRTRNKNIVKSRLFDGGDWLGEVQTTVFNQIPVIPALANFSIFENKVLYRGIVAKLMDAQRVFNYSKSREIEEGALAPRAKYWLTEDQTAGHEDTLATLNTNADPVQHFNADPSNPGPPQQQGGATINPGLKTLSDDMNLVLGQSAGLFAANMGNNPGLQSGVAIEKLQNKGDTGTVKFFSALELAICRTGRILVDAIPQVYDTQRQVRIMKEDGSFDMTVLNQQIQDQQTGQLVTLNDVSKGKYDVTCTAGPSFKNRQDETVSAIVEMGQVDPSIIELGGDVLFNNINSPGMDQIAGRKRQQIFHAGLIPDDQLTDEERQLQEQAAQQPPPPDPATLLAQAEQGKAEAQTLKVQVDAEVAGRTADREDFKAQQAAQQQQFDQAMTANQAITDQLTDQINSMKTILEAVGPGAIAQAQGALVIEAQREN